MLLSFMLFLRHIVHVFDVARTFIDPVLMGTLMMSSVLIVMGTLVSDLVYRVVDPRISKR